MQEDDLYPNDGAAFSVEPKDQVKGRQREKAETLQALPVIKDAISRLEERISFYESVKSVPNDVLTQPEAFMHTITANKLVADNLKSEKEWLEDLVERHFK